MHLAEELGEGLDHQAAPAGPGIGPGQRAWARRDEVDDPPPYPASHNNGEFRHQQEPDPVRRRRRVPLLGSDAPHATVVSLEPSPK